MCLRKTVLIIPDYLAGDTMAQTVMDRFGP